MSNSTDAFARLRRYVRDATTRLRIPGSLLGVTDRGVDRVAAFGVTSIEDPVPMTADTVFRIASLSKLVTATLVARLVHLGKLDLDTPVITYMPELTLADRDVQARVTLRHLLSHTGGWLDDPLMEIPDPVANPEVLADLPQLTPLGTVWSYSTTGFFIAGRVIEHVTGMSYGAALAEYLTGPLGMSRTGVLTEEAITYSVALGHQHANGGLALVRPWPTPSWDVAAQGLFSTTNDLVRFARLHIEGKDQRGTTLISDALLEEMRRPQVDDASRGIGWVIRPVGPELIHTHPGGLYGYACDLLVSPTRAFGLVVAANVSSHALDRGALRHALWHYLGLKERSIAPARQPHADLAEYAGRYIGVSRDLHVSVDDGFLVVQVVRRSGAAADGVERAQRPAPIRVAMFEKDRVIGIDEPLKGDARSQFIRDANGSVILFRFPTFAHVRYGPGIKLPDTYVQRHAIS